MQFVDYADYFFLYGTVAFAIGHTHDMGVVLLTV